jgi:hypothetical protein
MTFLSARRAGQRKRATYLGSVSILRVVGSYVVPRRLRVVWPPACLPIPTAPVETGTPPYGLSCIFEVTLRR